MINHMVNTSTGLWGKLNYFLKILNKGFFQGPILDIMDDTEFQNLHKLLPLIYGPTSLNFSYYSIIYYFFNLRIITDTNFQNKTFFNFKNNQSHYFYFIK